MKQLILLAVFFSAFFAKRMETALPAHSQKVSAEQVLSKVSDKLNSLKTLQYHYRRELNYPSEAYYHEVTGEIYLDFTSTDKIVGFKYQFNYQDFLYIFNGSQQFQCNKKEKRIEINHSPSKEENFKNAFFFYNSPLTLRFALPQIIADATIPKTIAYTLIGNKSFYALTFTLNKKTMGNFGDFTSVTQERKFIYRLLINKDTFIPVEVLQTNDVDDSKIKTNFYELKINSSLEGASPWDYSTYLTEYKLEEPKKETSQLIKAGKMAPDWILTQFEDEVSVTLSQYKGKLVVLEFWEKNCGYCIMAVPKLNEIYNRYKNKDFALLAINTRDTKELMSVFAKKFQPVYPLMYGSDNITKSYGISYFPTIVLIDKKGQIIYAGAFIPDQLRPLIERHI